ncbi:hypothetical protein PV336_15980 [Streptomyces sp. MI02-2A]|uniref:hypothetical protein n=1 Tax=Streptomyces sp. MI02-2A TaxID=3028688 RepID=UPI0029BB0611|nr:hypothetical protein [Streptomyces sp. MI02-2A]MDX3260719.1 hypothetical protein [Streptomyces sp. MI02-2A]
MQSPSGWEHLGQKFWDRVEPDPNSDCWIFQSNATVAYYNGKTLLSYVAGSDGRQRHRACRRRLCANPDHIREGHYNMGTPYAPRPRTRRQFYRQYSQC